MFFSSSWWPVLILSFKPVVLRNDPADFVDQDEGRGMLICNTVTGQGSVQSFDFIPPL